jgi:hypothetical protein
MAASLSDTAWIEWMTKLIGVASRQRYTATLPPQKFHCLLDELPLHLIPPGVFRNSRNNTAPAALVLNPDCSVLSAAEVPQEFLSRKDLLESFYLGTAIAWVCEPFTDNMQPFWLGPRLEPLVADIRAGKQAVSQIPGHEKFLLRTAGILTEADQTQKQAEDWSAKVNVAARLFREKDYAPIGGLIHPLNLAALRRYYRQAIRRGRIPLGDLQSSRRYVAHNEPVARYFHHQIGKVVSAVVGQPVKPSYVYFACYLSGAELKKHTDREQCEFSVTLCLDFSPEPEDCTSWPICLETRSGTVTVYQRLGDALIYRGTKVPHYRSVLREGYTSTSIFFHYVPADFPGSLD